MNLSYREMDHLYHLLDDTLASWTGPVMSKIEEDFRKIPDWLITICIQSKDSDIELLSGPQIVDKLEPMLTGKTAPEKIIIYTPYPVIADSVLDQLLNRYGFDPYITRFSSRQRQAWSKSGAYIYIATEDSPRGEAFDRGIVCTS